MTSMRISLVIPKPGLWNRIKNVFQPNPTNISMWYENGRFMTVNHADENLYITMNGEVEK